MALKTISEQRASLWLLRPQSRWRLWGLSLSFHGILIIFIMIPLSMAPQGGDRGISNSLSFVEITLSADRQTISPTPLIPAPTKPIETPSPAAPLKTAQSPKPVQPQDLKPNPKPDDKDEAQKTDVETDEAIPAQVAPSSSTDGKTQTDQPLNWAMIAPCWAEIGASKGMSVTLTLTTGADGALSAPPEILRPLDSPAPDEGRLTAEYLALHALATCGDTKVLKANSPTTITFLSSDDLKALSPRDYARHGGVYY